MTDLEHIFSSPAKISVLRVLYKHGAHLPLRHVAYLSKAPLFSVQRVLKQLMKEKLVKTKKEKNRLTFHLQKKHAAFDLISKIFQAEQKIQWQRDQKNKNAKAQAYLDFCHDSLKLFRTARAKHGS